MGSSSDNKKEKVLKYLNRNYNEIIQEQGMIQKQVDSHEYKVKEMYKAIEISEQEIDPNYNLFSPRKSGKIKMNDKLTSEVHILENELEELKYKNKRLIEKIGTTKDIIECIIGESDEDLFETNSSFLNSLIDSENEINDNKNENYTSQDNIEEKDIDVAANNENDFEMVTDELEDAKEYFFDDEIRKKFLNIQESEKNRIARDLHDTTVQNLTSLVHKSELCMKLVDMDPIRTKLELQTMMNVLKDSISELRNIIYGLKPMSLEDFGLIVTIKKYISQLNMSDGPKFKFECDGFENKNLDSIINLTLFRIIQEACNNAIKHSKAQNVDIYIDFMDDCINLIVEDDGIGFIHNNKEKREDVFSGFGLSIMKERAYLLSGNFMIDYANTDNKTGTKIVVMIPVDNE